MRDQILLEVKTKKLRMYVSRWIAKGELCGGLSCLVCLLRLPCSDNGNPDSSFNLNSDNIRLRFLVQL